MRPYLRAALAVLCLLIGYACQSRAADLRRQYAAPDGPVSATVGLCPSSDGTDTAVACSSPGAGASGNVAVTALPSLPSGSNTIGAVTGTVNVGNLPTTTTVAGAVSVSALPALPAGTNNIGGVVDSNSAAFVGEFAMTIGTTYPVGRSFKANCTVGGVVSNTYPDGSTGLWSVVVGIQTVPAQATAINSSGTTATCVYTNLK